MIWWFFDHSGKRLFSRSDAIEFEHYVDSMSFKGSFPNSGNVPDAGNLIGWQDDDDLWEVHEVSSVTYDAFGDDFEIEGSSIAVTELGTLVCDKCKMDDVAAKKALQTIIGKQTQWQLGTIPAAAEDDPMRKQRYRVTARKLYMYTQMSTRSKCLSKYKRGAYMTPIEQVSDLWWQMQGTDGRVGYVPYPTKNLVRDGNAGDEDRKVTCDEKFVSLWDLLMTIQDGSGWIIVPRVTIDDTGITGRYIDVRTSEPDFHGVRLSCSTNISDGTIKYDVSELYTALYGIGKDDLTFKNVTWTTAAGFPVNKPKGQIYVASDEALALYGHDGIHRFGVVNLDDETNASELLYKTYDALQVYSAPQITIEGTIADLYKLGYGGESMRLYDKVYCILNPIGRRLELRITKLTRNLVEPEKTKPTIGSIDNTDLVATTVKASAQSVGIKSWQLGSGSVGNDALNSGSVTADKVAAGAIVADAISAGAIVTEKLASGAVTADTIGVGAVTADKISSGAVTADKIGAGAVNASKIEAYTITSDQIAAGTITGDRLASQTITAVNIAGKTITVDQLQAALITADCGLIADSAIQTAQIADSSITAAKIVSLNADVIEAGTLKADRLLITGGDGVIYQINAAASGLSKTELAKDKYKEALNGTVIVAQSITAAQIAAATITGNEIAANTIKAANIDVSSLFANETFTNSLYTSTIYGGKSIKIMVSDTAAAASAASKAQTTANNASTAASNAQTTADAANTAAGNAQSTADAASTAASKAQSTADNATTTANSAKSEAESATSTANTAKSTADAASTKAGNAETTANTANTTANSAKTQADSAVNTANTANTTANAANTTANTAKNTADTAKSTADTAKITADEAKALTFTASDDAPTSCDTGYRWLDTGITPQQMRTWRGLNETPKGATMTTDRSIDETVDGESPKLYPASWTPIRSGSGTASASNVRALVGRTATYGHIGKNLCHPLYDTNRTITQSGLTIVYDATNQTLTVSGTATGGVYLYWYTGFYNSSYPQTLGRLEQGKAYTLSVPEGLPTKSGLQYNYRNESNIEKGLMTTAGKGIGTAIAKAAIVPDTFWGGRFIFWYANSGAVFGDGHTFTIQFEEGDTATAYEPYNTDIPETVATLPETIYGGTINPDGSGTKTWGHIASYSGETLPGKWVSSMDTYSEGATPTVGAEVAYELATPVEYTATMTNVVQSATIDNTNGTITSDITVTVTDDSLTTATVKVNGTTHMVTLTNGTGSMTLSAAEQTYTITADAAIKVEYTCSGWETVNDTGSLQSDVESVTAKAQDAYDRALDAQDGVTRIGNYVEIATDGLNVKSAADSTNYVNVNNTGVDIYVTGKKTSSFISKGLVLGNYILWQPEESGGLAFNLLSGGES